MVTVEKLESVAAAERKLRAMGEKVVGNTSLIYRCALGVFIKYDDYGALTPQQHDVRNFLRGGA